MPESWGPRGYNPEEHLAGEIGERQRLAQSGNHPRKDVRVIRRPVRGQRVPKDTIPLKGLTTYPCPDLDTIREAAQRIAPYAHRTPVLTCAGLDRLFGARLYFKCENLQKVGAFKFRGACNAVFLLSKDDASHGVATHSSGNHAVALALAAQERAITAYIVMPSSAPAVKKSCRRRLRRTNHLSRANAGGARSDIGSSGRANRRHVLASL
jgi:hypothetical protein